MEKTKNVLITSAGTRVSLLNFFKEEALSIDVKIYASDLEPALSPACQIAFKYFKSPKVGTDEYINFLVRTCLDNSIGLIVPTIDLELEQLSLHRDLFLEKGIKVIVSDSEFVKICNDKRLSNIFFNDLGIRTPKIFGIGELDFPVYAKPYNGSLSKNNHLIKSKEDLTENIISDKDLIFMEYVSPEIYSEYTVDAFYNLKGHLISLVPRKRLKVRAGEINKGVTKKNFVMDFLLEKFKFLKGACGCITLQFFVNEPKERILGIEINPRFGGGYPLSHLSGANYIKYIFDEYILNKDIFYSENWKQNVLMLRYDAEIIVELDEEF